MEITKIRAYVESARNFTKKSISTISDMNQTIPPAYDKFQLVEMTSVQEPGDAPPRLQHPVQRSQTYHHHRQNKLYQKVNETSPSHESRNG